MRSTKDGMVSDLDEEIVRMACDGKSIAEVARATGLSQDEVKRRFGQVLSSLASESYPKH